MERGSTSTQTAVWVRDETQAWVRGLATTRVVSADAAEIAVVRDEDSVVVTVAVAKKKATAGAAGAAAAGVEEVSHEDGEDWLSATEDVKLANIFEGENVGGYVEVSDLTHLIHLHEPEILEALSVRFAADMIYTNTGPILLAVNPFKALPLYTASHLELYYSTGIMRSQNMDPPKLPPHVYAVGDSAYRCLVDSGDPRTRKGAENQAILVSGESGAGKTESTKFIMSYLATIARGGSTTEETAVVASSSTASQKEQHIADQVLESNPILESLGNARTLRNDNSSRFGKFIEMHFNATGKLTGAKIVTYLLEKARLAKQTKMERNFHIFYQMMEGGSEEEKTSKWFFPDSLETSNFTMQSECYVRRDGVLDKDMHERMVTALDVMGFSTKEKEDLFRTVSAVLNMGNITFTGDDASAVDRSDPVSVKSLKACAELLSVDSALFEKNLLVRTIEAVGETYQKNLSVTAACDGRDALAKTLYSRLFNWVVARVNASIQKKNLANGGVEGAKYNFIGVLDIFGFEVFQQNSFEQLCINYANETLQQQFNQFVFKLEQIEYEREGIKWSFIDFPDNQVCLDLIEGKPIGLFALIDEQCLFPKGNDTSLANKLYEHLEKHERFSATRPQKVKFQFVVKHYAGDVCYSTNGFCSKNKDEIHGEALELLRSSTNEFIRDLFPVENKAAESASIKRKASSIQSATVGSQFKQQLASLLETIRSTRPHYIRCLKPNDENVPSKFMRQRVVDQLRYGGVLEAVKVARAGYPTRFLLNDFVQRYFMLASIGRKNLGSPEALRGACESIVKALNLKQFDHYQIGKTKIFLRKGAFEQIETRRSKRMRDAAIMITATIRGIIKRKEFRKVTKANVTIQRVIRGFIGRRRALGIRKERSAIAILSCARRFLERIRYLRKKKAALSIQRLRRGVVARRHAKVLASHRAAKRIQCHYRRLKAIKHLKKNRAAAISVQTAWRAKAARSALKALRMEAREVGTLQKKIEQLQERVKELETELEQERSRSAVVIQASTPAETAPPVTVTVEDPLLLNLKEKLESENLELKQRVQLLEKELAAEREANRVSQLENLKERDEMELANTLKEQQEMESAILTKQQVEIKDQSGGSDLRVKQLEEELEIERQAKLSSEAETLSRVRQLEEELVRERQSKVELLSSDQRVKQLEEELASMRKLREEDQIAKDEGESIATKIRVDETLNGPLIHEEEEETTPTKESASTEASLSASSDKSLEAQNGGATFNDSGDDLTAKENLVANESQTKSVVILTEKPALDSEPVSVKFQSEAPFKFKTPKSRRSLIADNDLQDNTRMALSGAEVFPVKEPRSSIAPESGKTHSNFAALEEAKRKQEETQEDLEREKLEHLKAKEEVKLLKVALQKAKEQTGGVSPKENGSSQDLATLKSLLERNRELEDEVGRSAESTGDLIAKMCDIQNLLLERENEILLLKGANKDLKNKHDSMEAITEQASTVKIQLAKRLEQLILENRQLRVSISEKDEQLIAQKKTIEVLSKGN